MLIIADNNIPYAEEAFRHLGEVRTVQGRGLSADQVNDADILLVRSTVKVDAGLLGGASPRFVGTATIGTDHVDLDYLQRREIAFAAAPGSNADSVAEYWSAAVLMVAARHGLELTGKTCGVVGVGNVGRRVVRRAKALGMRVLKCDPPLGRRTGSDEYRPLDELLTQSDLITMHVPLAREGSDPTFHMAGGDFFEKLKAGAFFINTARGAVHDSGRLAAALDSGKLAHAVLDVWEGEPDVDAGLLERVDLGTPHIAGHSLDGKANGTYALYREACKLLGAKEEWKPAKSLPPPEVPRLDIDAAGFDVQLTCTEAALSVYNISGDDERMRQMATMPGLEREAYFTEMRVDYPVRRSFAQTRVVLQRGDNDYRQALAGLGFKVV